MTIAEFFIIRPHGPNCWMGLGAFRERVRLQKEEGQALGDCRIVSVSIAVSLAEGAHITSHGWLALALLAQLSYTPTHINM